MLEQNHILAGVKLLWPIKIHEFPFSFDGSHWWASDKHSEGSGESPVLALYSYCLKAQNQISFYGEPEKWNAAINFLAQFVEKQTFDPAPSYDLETQSRLH